MSTKVVYKVEFCEWATYSTVLSPEIDYAYAEVAAGRSQRPDRQFRIVRVTTTTQEEILPA